MADTNQYIKNLEDFDIAKISRLKFLKYVLKFLFRLFFFILRKTFLFLFLTLKFVLRVTLKDFRNYRKFVKSDLSVFLLDILNWIFLITPVVFGLKLFWRFFKCFVEFLFFIFIWFFSFLILNYRVFEFLRKLTEYNINLFLKWAYDYFYAYREIHIRYPEIELKIKGYASFLAFFYVAKNVLINEKWKLFNFVFSWEKRLTDSEFYAYIFLLAVFVIYDILKLIVIKILWRRLFLKSYFWEVWRERLYRFLEIADMVFLYIAETFEDIIWAHRFGYLYLYIKWRILALFYIVFFFCLHILEFIIFDLIMNGFIILFIELHFKYQKTILFIYKIKLSIWFVYFFLFTEIGRFIFFSNDCKRAWVYIRYYVKSWFSRFKFSLKFYLAKLIYLVKISWIYFSYLFFIPSYFKYYRIKGCLKVLHYLDDHFKCYWCWLLEVRIYYAIKYLFTVQKFLLELYIGRPLSFRLYCFLLFLFCAYWCFVTYNVIVCLIYFLF